LQSSNKDIIRPISKDLELSNKLFDQHESTNFLHLEQRMNDKKEQMSHKEDRFKCFYCSQVCSSNNGVEHIDNEHPGKLYYPTPWDFENRMSR
jgi:hypothetical protein